MLRKGETNIGVLIIFTVTIVIATGVLATLSFFYKKYSTNKKYYSILGNIHSNIADIKAIGICKDSNSINIKYDVIHDIYTLSCSNQLGKNLKKLDILTSLSGCDTTDTFCEYKIKK